MNRISLLGFLGLLGLLGLVTGNTGFYGFFGFFAFFGWVKIRPDERFQANLGRAAKNVFFAGMALFPIIVVWAALGSFEVAYSVGFAANFVIQHLVFTLSLVWLERGGGGL